MLKPMEPGLFMMSVLNAFLISEVAFSHDSAAKV